MESRKCDWCQYNPYGCDATCDFKSLEMSRDAILDRIKSESASINELKQTILLKKASKEEARVAFNELNDKSRGIQVMTAVGKSKFGITDEEVKKIIESTQVKMNPLKLLLQMKKLERGGK